MTLLSKGFRPFFIGASLIAVLFVPIWLLQMHGVVDVTGSWTPSLWHGHEMVYGFALAVVSGFLLTAVENWTGQVTARGGWLGALFAVWLAGRIAMLGAGVLPGGLVAAIDLAFVPALAAAIGRALSEAKNRRNYVFFGLLAMLGGSNLVTHLEQLGVIEGFDRTALWLAVDLIIVMALIVGGRIIPLFTRNATGDAEIRSHPRIDKATFVAVAAALVTTVAGWPWWAAGTLWIVAGVLAAARALHWGFRASWSQPILWVLHVGYAWIPVGFVLRGLAEFTPLVTSSTAIHALTAGAIGTLTLGMMARVALGHTGRRLRVPTPIAIAFGALTIAAIIRVGSPLVTPSFYLTGIVVSGVVWALAFATYLVVYAPILTSPRVDGRPG